MYAGVTIVTLEKTYRNVVVISIVIKVTFLSFFCKNVKPHYTVLRQKASNDKNSVNFFSHVICISWPSCLSEMDVISDDKSGLEIGK